MSYISPEKLKEIQEASNIVDYIGQYVDLRKNGNDYSGLCPFHNEKTPSFHVSSTKQVFHCFGCGKSGNIFQFVSQYEQLSFPDAVKKVASYFNLSTDFVVENTNNPVTLHRQKLLSIQAKAAKFYEHILLHTKLGQDALDYLYKRGLTKEDILEFGIGYAPPNSGNNLLAELMEQEDLSEEDYSESGLFNIDNNGNPRDRFRERIMFPIRNEYGDVIAFSGRKMSQDDEIPKYINSPETPIFDKSSVLFNLDLAKGAIRKEDQVILFEGYMDVISAYKAGVKNGVASMGTSLTNKQIQKIKQLTHNVLICYDGDKAGIEASERARMELINDSSLQINLMWLPDKQDPDEYIKEHGKGSFKKLIDSSQLSNMQFIMKYLKQSFNLQKETDKLRYIELILPEIAKLSSKVEQNIYLKDLANDTDVELTILTEQLSSETSMASQKQEKVIKENSPFLEKTNFDDNSVSYVVNNPKSKVQPLTILRKAEYMLLYRAFYEKYVRDILKDLDFYFPDTEVEELYVLLDDYMNWHGEFLADDFYDKLETNSHKELFNDILSLTMSKQSTVKEIHDYLNIIQNYSLEEELQVKKQELQEASKMGNVVLEKELASEIMLILKKLKNRRKGHA